MLGRVQQTFNSIRVSSHKSNLDKRRRFSTNPAVDQAAAEKSGLWSHLGLAPLDGNHATAEAYEKDPSPLKVNLGRGVYKDDNGKSWVLPSVREAERIIAESKPDHEYIPFKGIPKFVKATQEFAFGEENPALKDKKIATVQTISGTGALRVGAEFLARFKPKSATNLVFLPDPTYVNHFPIFKNTGFETQQYRYYDEKTNGLDFAGLIEDLKNAPMMSVVLFHACAHNPTGVDPSFEQWKEIAQVVKDREHIIFFDSAYQGFASGDPTKDAAAYRYFLEQGIEIMVAQSYSKNFGLYGQRVGALNVVTKKAAETDAVYSQLNQVIRPMYSNPPAHGARIVSTVLGDPNLKAQWQKDVKTMADRIIGARKALVDNLKKLGSKRDWSHITKQIGMFAYSGLSREEVQKLRDRHVYMNFDGRMSISGINSHNVDYLAKAMHEVTQK